MRSVTILGATGSIGQSTIDLIARDPDAYRVEALTGGRNLAQLAADARRLNARLAVTAHEDCRAELAERLSGTGIEVAAGAEAICEAASRPVDWVMSAIVGFAGLAPGLEVLRRGGTLALANKETLVAAGPLVMETARRHGGTVLPVDSEHSAIFQALRGEEMSSVERVIITASGGAFRDWPLERLASATPEEAATHPNWAMGQRITIDSASMFNKALEMIEAKEFFALAPSQIEVLIHRESLVHALVGHNDGGLIAHIGPPDMRHAIGHALSWPARAPLPVERLDLAAIGQLSFAAPEAARYPALDLAYRVMEAGGGAGAIFNAAKEAALDSFLSRQIRFTDMSGVVGAVLDRFLSTERRQTAMADLDTIIDHDRRARLWTKEAADQLAARTGG
ncbi:1-deoxy-D-xylulose-5-phosphate reductoisomerase [Pseudoroseicyclus tamaricis]|uniref:1-deoxy-D-xylulose 5-phosphate reductoisomerase n=1 Tax=Pseudoroseicyclus tamaricis TaxID=2705421 RepID=A0A6B2JPJ8_9RHOB|nr:1-deoxy-D-xylulose-5-phosphate reductoisomerase [Pseudoroseicyclus tamaricis]NDV00607.1 1-deoxy-D-xylulose-5-phosphate reductoisomerase [Pseudoroseicyclus tamaricis]